MTRKRMVILASAFVGAFCIMIVGTASAGSNGQSNCPKAGYTCLPANVSTHNSSKSSAFSHTTIVEKLTVTQKITKFQRAKGVVVAVFQGGSSHKGCVNPIKNGWIKVGGDFRNTRANGTPFWTFWKQGWAIKNPHRVTIDGFQYWKGDKCNCGNKDILIPIGQTPPHHSVASFEVRSVKDFLSKFNRWASTRTSHDSTSSNSKAYNCKGIGGTRHGAWCWIPLPLAKTPAPAPKPQPTPQPGAAASVNCPTGTAKDSQGQCVAQAVNCTAPLVNVNGSCVAQSVNVEQDCKNKGGNYSSANNTCTVIVQVGNCSNLTTVINYSTGAQTTNTNQGGNCNTTVVNNPPPSSTPPPAVVHYTNLTCQGQEEITGNASSKLVCQVSNDNGGPIALDVTVLTNKGALLVSGIQCSSQNGAPTCQGAGTYEIRIKGVNDGKAPVYADVQVIATSNGVSSKPFTQRFQIDSSCSNFC